MSASFERILVTGASRGIGRALAEKLIGQGRRVALVARDHATLDFFAAASGGYAVAIAADLADATVVASIVPRAVQALGGLDAVVACAGIAEHRPIEAIDAAHIERHFAVNVRAPLLLARELVAHLRARRGEGAIVFVASTLALGGVPGTSVYAASKGALIAATRALAIELAPAVRVCCIAPGGTHTKMVRGREESLAKEHPLGRLARPSEIAEAITFLLDAPFATGTVLAIDGGQSARL